MKFKAFITYISEVHFFISYISEVHFLIMPCQIVTIIQSISKDKFKAFILYISEVHFFLEGGWGVKDMRKEGGPSGSPTWESAWMAPGPHPFLFKVQHLPLPSFQKTHFIFFFLNNIVWNSQVRSTYPLILPYREQNSLFVLSWL